MSLTEKKSAGSLNGATPVTVVTAPSAGRRVVVAGSIYNADTSVVVVTLSITVSASPYIVTKIEMQPGDTLMIERDDAIVLDTTDTLECVLAGAAATTNPTYRFSYADVA